jgi:hypothetical protein
LEGFGDGIGDGWHRSAGLTGLKFASGLFLFCPTFLGLHRSKFSARSGEVGRRMFDL